MFPPNREGGMTECGPGLSGATPIVPGNGREGNAIRSPKRTRPSSIREMRSHGSGKSSASSPNPGTIAVQPQVLVRSSSTSTSRTSPGRAPRTNTGPATGFIRSKSMVARSATTACSPIWSREASGTWSSTTSPSSASSAGSRSRFQVPWYDEHTWRARRGCPATVISGRGTRA